MEELNILFTSVGRRSYLVKYFKESLRGRGLIHAANSSDLSPAFSAADRHVVTPLIYDGNYIPFLLRYCEKNKIRGIISLFDIDLPVLSANRGAFEKIGTKVIVSAPEVISVCNDKWTTYNFLKENGFNTPETFISVDDAKQALEKDMIRFPLFIKPRWGMGSLFVYEADTVEELEVFYGKIIRNIRKSYLKYESVADIGESVIIQEKVSGKEHGLDVINDLDGNYQTTIAKKKYAMRSGETDSAETVDNMLLKGLGQALGKKLKHIGNLDCDVFVDGEKLTVLEMNARFGGGYPFSHLAGVDLPSAIINWILGKKIDGTVLKERIGVFGQKDIEIIQLK